MLPSYFHLRLSYFQNFSSIIFHIPYSTFSIVLIVIPVFLFRCPFFQLPHVISSNQFPVVFRVRRSLNFSHSWPVISLVFFLPDVTFSSVFLSSWLFLCFPFPIFWRIRIVFLQFCATYFNHVMYTNWQIPNFLLVCFLLASLFLVSILPSHCLRISVPSLNTRHSLKNVVFPEFSFNSEVFFPFHLLPRLFAISFQVACFFCSFSLASGLAR